MKYINKLSNEKIIEMCKQMGIIRLKNGNYKITISNFSDFLELKIVQSTYKEFEELGENLFQLKDFSFTEKWDWNDEESLKAYKIYFKVLYDEFGQQYFNESKEYFEKYKKLRTKQFKDIELSFKEEIEDCNRILDFINIAEEDLKNEK